MRKFGARDFQILILVLCIAAFCLCAAGYEVQVYMVFYAICFLCLGALALLAGIAVFGLAFVFILNLCIFLWNLSHKNDFRNYIRL